MLSEPVNSEKSDPPYCTVYTIYPISIFEPVYNIIISPGKRQDIIIIVEHSLQYILIVGCTF